MLTVFISVELGNTPPLQQPLTPFQPTSPLLALLPTFEKVKSSLTSRDMLMTLNMLLPTFKQVLKTREMFIVFISEELWGGTPQPGHLRVLYIQILAKLSKRGEMSCLCENVQENWTSTPTPIPPSSTLSAGFSTKKRAKQPNV